MRAARTRTNTPPREAIFLRRESKSIGEEYLQEEEEGRLKRIGRR